MMFRQPRQHNEKHLRFIRSLPCLVCHDNTSTEAAHIRFACDSAGKRSVGLAEKPGDLWAIPLCGTHHRHQHDVGEVVFWQSMKLDPIFCALALWGATGNHEIGEQIVRLQGAE